MAQGYPPRRSARRPEDGRRGPSGEPQRPGRAERRGRSDRPDRPDPPRWDAFEDASDDEVPPWAGPSIYPTGPGRRELRPPAPDRPDPGGYEPREYQQRAPDQGRHGATTQEWAGPPDTEEPRPREAAPERNQRRRAAATRARKSRRKLLAAGGLLVVVIAGVVLGLTGNLPWQGGTAPSADSGLVTTFQRGEFRSVPNACHAIGPATLSQYLPGKVARVAQSLGSATQSQCTWTLDRRPNFRVLTVSSQAYTPSLLSSGDGSATFGAIDAYQQEFQTLRNPSKSSKAPKAQLGTAVGLGHNAFTALQVFRIGGAVTNEVTVVVRDRNAVIIVTMQGQQRGGGFGPVPVATLRAGALAAAHEVLAGIH